MRACCKKAQAIVYVWPGHLFIPCRWLSWQSASQGGEKSNLASVWREAARAAAQKTSLRHFVSELGAIPLGHLRFSWKFSAVAFASHSKPATNVGGFSKRLACAAYGMYQNTWEDCGYYCFGPPPLGIILHARRPLIPLTFLVEQHLLWLYY